MKNVFLVNLKAKYQNDPNTVKRCQMFHVTEIFLEREIYKYFLTGLKEHTVCYNIFDLSLAHKCNSMLSLILSTVKFPNF